MRINFIAPAVGNSGGMQVVFKYAYELEKKGHVVKVYAPIIPYVTKKMCFIQKIIYIVPRIFLNIYRFKVKKTPQCLCRYVKWKTVMKINNKFVSDADIVIATAWPTAYDVNQLNESKGKKFYFVQDYEIWDNKKLGEESYKLNLKKIVIADWIRNKLEKLGIDVSNIPVVYNGIDYKTYDLPRRQKKSDVFVFLMLDHTLEKKGVIYGIKAFEIIKEIYPNIKLKMFGMKKSDSVPKYVDYYENPSREKIVSLYNNADIFIFPSLEEGWGLTVIEAMASGCAVIGTNVGALLEIGNSRVNCMKSEPKDINSMASNIKEIMENKSLYDFIIYNGKKTAQKLDWNKAVDCLEKFLLEY